MDCVTAKWNSSRKSVDLTLSSIPTGFDRDTLREVPIFCQLLRNPGSHCFLIVTKPQFATLYRIFEEKDFKAVDHTFKILDNINTILRSVTTVFPQHYGNIAILAKKDDDQSNKLKYGSLQAMAMMQSVLQLLMKF